MREREREGKPFCEEINLCKEWKREWQIYSKRGVNKKRQNKGRWRKSWIVILMQRVVGRWKDKGGKKVGESVNIKKKKVYSKKNYRKIEKKKKI